VRPQGDRIQMTGFYMFSEGAVTPKRLGERCSVGGEIVNDTTLTNGPVELRP
jgi:hypothetical protein